MNKTTRKKLGIVLLFVFLILINVIPVFVFREKIQITPYSWVAVLFLLIVVIRAVDAYVFKTKRKYLGSFGPKGSLTTSLPESEYTKDFYRMLIIYCAAIPFYIPAICFSKESWHLFLTFLIYGIPQLIFFLIDVQKIRYDKKVYRQKQSRHEKEREEQERREEFGRWK